MTISVVCPIASPLRGSMSGKPSPTKPMSLCGLLRNRTGNDSAGFSVRSRLRLAVTKGTRIDIGAISLTACTSDERLLGRPEG